MNGVGHHFLYLLLLEEERLEQREVCRGGHSRHFLVLKDILILLGHRGLRTKGGYAVAAGDAAVLVVMKIVYFEVNERAMLKNDEEWMDILVWVVLSE